MTLWLATLATLAQPQAAPLHGNREMARMFADDQAARQGVKPEQYRDRAFVTAMIAADTARRARTRALLDAGQLTTAEDFYAAAFIFQHGTAATDYLLAHTLAGAAVARGKADAAWIAAATLDRYLQKVGQPQVYGTQFTQRDGGVTMEPYDTGLLPDSLRTAAGVPVRAEQDAKLARMRGVTAPAK